MFYIILLICGVIFNVSAQFSLKNAMKAFNALEQNVSFFNKILQILGKPLFWLALFFYGMGFMMYAIAISKIELSRAYPFSSVAAVILVFLVSVFFLNEEVTAWKISGVILCTAGILLIFK